MLVLRSASVLLLCSSAMVFAGAVVADPNSSEAQQFDAPLQFAQAAGQAADESTATEENAGAAESPDGQGATEEAAESEETVPEEGPAEFTEAFLQDPDQLMTGEELWESTCQHCHGAKAYPGKAPKLRPSRYTPEFVFDRVTHGFRKMPAWKDVFTKEQRMAITAYVLSDDFSP